ncbi:MAG: hypothetical protein GF388_09650 [Candidatus Aegiribacteria sp.]|nr:hypothetical protein [Candidatus Aegiribacteria sp.]MBD3295302.1 hypothetical protein [Candidatus Fermentibacteria bacterium]
MRTFIVLLMVCSAGLLLAARDADISPNPGTPGAGDADLVELDYFDLEALGASNRCVGIGYDGTNFWVTDAQNSGGPLWIHIISGTSPHTLITTVDQNGFSSGWGLRDLCWDGTYMYGSESSQVDYYDDTYAKVGSYTCNAVSPNRAQAWDGTYFYTGSFSAEIYQVDWDGVSGSSASYSTWSTAVANTGTYGAAWDYTNNCLWVSTASSDGMLYQIDDTGTLITTWDLNPEVNMAGGCTMGDYGTDSEELWVLEQGDVDGVYCFETSPLSLQRDTWGAIKTVF